LFELRQCRSGDPVAVRGAGVMDEDANRPQLATDAFNCSDQFVRYPNIRGNGKRCAAHISDLVREFVDELRRARDQPDVNTFPGEATRQCGTEPGSDAGDERDAIRISNVLRHKSDFNPISHGPKVLVPPLVSELMLQGLT
jgi:hypothetical protein